MPRELLSPFERNEAVLRKLLRIGQREPARAAANLQFQRAFEPEHVGPVGWFGQPNELLTGRFRPQSWSTCHGRTGASDRRGLRTCRGGGFEKVKSKSISRGIPKADERFPWDCRSRKLAATRVRLGQL